MLTREASHLAVSLGIEPCSCGAARSGFAACERTYPAGTEAEREVAPTQDGRAFAGWQADGGRLVPGQRFLWRLPAHSSSARRAAWAAARRAIGTRNGEQDT